MQDTDDFKNLNPEQRIAVTHGPGPLLIFAGAGSGKTRVLTHRVAHLVMEHGVSADDILAVTFTNKAAREMKSRVGQLFPDQRPPNWVATFHAIGVRILRRHAKLLDFTSNFAIYDTSDSLAALKRVFKKLGIDPKVLDPKLARRLIDKAKNNYQFADSFKDGDFASTPMADMLAEVYEGYQQELQAANAMDFGDLLCNLVTLFKLEPSILEYYQNKFKFILVDEYQDTNKVQYMLIRMLAAKHHNLCVVGDDDQSIYAFRGATIENILNFQKDFPEAKVVILEENYRSSKNILDTATSIISRNDKRQRKNLRTSNAAGAPIIGFKAFDEQEEAQFVVREIAALIEQGISPKEIAVFYRTNAQSRSIEEALVESGIPYEIFGGHRFYERKEIKDIIAYLKLLANPQDNQSFMRIINTPTRGIGAKALGNIVAYAIEHKLTLLSALRQALFDKAPFIKGAAAKKFNAFLELYDSLAADYSRACEDLVDDTTQTPYETTLTALSNLLKQIAVKSTYLERLKSEDTLEAESRTENIYELMKVAKEFVKNSLNEQKLPLITDFLDRASLTSDLDEANTKQGEETPESFQPISMMTLHLAKGLEFDNVFIVGFEEGILPHMRSLEDAIGIEEERRLCYVGITRARKQLFLSRARSRQTYGAGGWCGGIPSRFMEDVPDHLVDDRNTGFLETYL
jgi:DNA helicase-2/ATP-dependent DNA helicase PcrA